MATPRLTPREKLLRRIDRAYWRWLETGEDDGTYDRLTRDLLVLDQALDGCPPDCPQCSIPPSMIPRRTRSRS